MQDGLPHLTDLARSKNTPGDTWLSDSTAEELGVLRRDLRDGGIRSGHDGDYMSQRKQQGWPVRVGRLEWLKLLFILRTFDFTSAFE